MEKELFDNLMESCKQSLEYIKGDKTKGREVIVEIPDENINDMYNKLTDNDKYFVREMIQRLSH